MVLPAGMICHMPIVSMLWRRCRREHVSRWRDVGTAMRPEALVCSVIQTSVTNVVRPRSRWNTDRFSMFSEERTLLVIGLQNLGCWCPRYTRNIMNVTATTTVVDTHTLKGWVLMMEENNETKKKSRPRATIASAIESSCTGKWSSIRCINSRASLWHLALDCWKSVKRLTRFSNEISWARSGWTLSSENSCSWARSCWRKVSRVKWIFELSFCFSRTILSILEIVKDREWNVQRANMAPKTSKEIPHKTNILITLPTIVRFSFPVFMTPTEAINASASNCTTPRKIAWTPRWRREISTGQRGETMQHVQRLPVWRDRYLLLSKIQHDRVALTRQGSSEIPCSLKVRHEVNHSASE